jgi:hypothetical protein
MTSNNRKRKAQPTKRSKQEVLDCIEVKRRAQAGIHQKIKGMTRKEEVAYWNRPPDGPLEVWWRSIQEHSASVQESPLGRDEDTARNRGPSSSGQGNPAR